MQDKKFVIGVDGGGTKTIAMVADEFGRNLERKKGGPTNYHSSGIRISRRNLKKLLSPFVRRYPIDTVVFGFAGLDSDKDFLVYKKIVSRILPMRIHFELYNDAETAIEAIPGDDPKFLIVAGTGSTVWAQRGGEKAKAGGFDFLLSDEGSAYDLGMRALRAAVRSFDGRGKKTILEKLILRKVRAKDMSEVAAKIYFTFQRHPEDFKTSIASFAPLVGAAFQKKDVVAEKILKESANELSLGVKAVAKKLHFMPSDPCIIGYVGSVFQAPLLKDFLTEKIKKLFPKARFADSIDPVVGAVKIALDRLREKRKRENPFGNPSTR
jgi:N-acetylglucosamine kinase-like BadF-type ATPase